MLSVEDHWSPLGGLRRVDAGARLEHPRWLDALTAPGMWVALRSERGGGPDAADAAAPRRDQARS